MGKILMILMLFASTNTLTAQVNGFLGTSFEIIDEPFIYAVKKIFNKVNVSYSIDVKDIESYGRVYLKLNGQAHFHDVLTRILASKELVLYIDKNFVYHIDKNDPEKMRFAYVIPNTKDTSEIIELIKGKVFEPYMEYKDNIVNNILEKIAAKKLVLYVDRNFVYHVDNIDYENLHYAYVMPNAKDTSEVIELIRNKCFEPPLEYKDKNINSILDEIFAKTGFSYFWYDEKLKNKYKEKKVNYALKEKTEQEKFLSQILDSQDLKYTKDYHNKRYVIIMKNQKIKIKTVSYALTYASASEMARQVRSVLSPIGDVEVDEPTNTLIITDEEKLFEKFEDFLKGFD